MIPEGNELRPNTRTITEMDVNWIANENAEFDYYPDADDVAFRTAKRDLSIKGYVDSLLKLLNNETLSETCNAETGWETVLSGRACVQVTLIPDKQNDALGNLLLQDMTRRKDEMSSNETKPPSRENAATSNGDPAKSSASKVSGSSRFGYASE